MSYCTPTIKALSVVATVVGTENAVKDVERGLDNGGTIHVDLKPQLYIELNTDHAHL